MRRCRGAGLAALAAVLLVAVVRAQVQQEPSAETTEGTSISINCSHPNKQFTEYIYWYRQLPGRGPAFLVSTLKDSKKLTDPPGRLSVAADRRSSALWLARPRRGDAAVYYCALRDTGRGAGAAAGHEPPRAGPGLWGGGGGTAPGGPARGRCRSARRRLLAPPGPARPRPAPPSLGPRGGSPARPAPAPAPAPAPPPCRRHADRNPPRERGGIATAAAAGAGGAREGALAAAGPAGSRRGAAPFCSAQGGGQQRSSCPRAALGPAAGTGHC
ncbi:CASP-like protein 4A2 [Aquila chrysaetos chrysaetos]|uniref:CASP-like protein 4A2 n=1 Tax=Aquila chrysaetos chrysaetos TaxID=223781 RepID=UPI0011772CE3|nr:CASP-like protein 4A2 [Aquila chrysaetos chrysaetos]